VFFGCVVGGLLGGGQRPTLRASASRVLEDDVDQGLLLCALSRSGRGPVPFDGICWCRLRFYAIRLFLMKTAGLVCVLCSRRDWVQRTQVFSCYVCL